VKHAIKAPIPAFIVSAYDVTERRRVEKELLEAKSQAELYLDLMGHDINNMHQMALGYLEIARDAEADEGQKVLLDKPIEVLQRSARLIRNVRKLQRLREGMINVQRIDLCTQLSELQSEYGAVHDKTVSLNLNGHTGCYVLANELLYDVFANLVGNAIKHSERRASITISLDSRKEAGRLCYTVSVEDDGPGIPDDFKDCIFNRLLKGTTRANGSGIGLYLVKSLVDSYQGRVWVEDRVPDDYTKGAKFVVMLPAIEQ
jgi:signal transduction histidine kinase